MKRVSVKLIEKYMNLLICFFIAFNIFVPNINAFSNTLSSVPTLVIPNYNTFFVSIDKPTKDSLIYGSAFGPPAGTDLSAIISHKMVKNS